MALQTDEVRLFNWINFEEDGIYFQVTEITETGFRVKNNQEETWIEADQFSGIPLTPEILESCGAKLIDGEWTYSLSVDAISFKARFVNDRKCYSEIGGIYMGDRISALHHLQNLYSSLTLRELKINLTPSTT